MLNFANLSFKVSPQFKRYAESVEIFYEAALNAALVSKFKFLCMRLSVCMCVSVLSPGICKIGRDCTT